jgi:hypothetical protein
MRAHTMPTCTQDVYDKMEPAESVCLCSVEHVTDEVVHLINCIKNSRNSLKDCYVTLFHALFSHDRVDVRDQNKVMED